MSLADPKHYYNEAVQQHGKERVDAFLLAKAEAHPNVEVDGPTMDDWMSELGYIVRDERSRELLVRWEHGKGEAVDPTQRAKDALELKALYARSLKDLLRMREAYAHVLGLPAAPLPSLTSREIDSRILAEVQTELRWPSFSADQLQAMETDPLEYLPLLGQDGYFIRGMAHLVAAFPKVGKTELMTRIVRDWCYQDPDDREDWSEMHPVVAYFSEESTAVWSQRIKNLDFGIGGEHFQIVAAYGMPPDQVLQRIENEDMLALADVIVLDTLRAFSHIQDENSAEMAAAVKPFVEYCQRKHKTLIILHHTRKSGGEHGEGVAGHHSLIGSFDVIIEIGRVASADNQRTVSVMGRLVNPQKGVYERLEDGSMRWLGSQALVTKAAVKERVLPVLSEAADWLTTKEVWAALGPPLVSEEQVRLALLELANAQAVDRKPQLSEDATRKTVRWRLTPVLSR